MSDSDANYLDTFPGWLRNLGQDAESLGGALETDGVSAEALEALAGGLNYLFKSLDLIPDGIDDIGYLDDAFVLRVACMLAVQESLGDIPDGTSKTIRRLADENATVKDFLAGDYGRLETYVKGLRKSAARGRSVADILKDDAIRAEFLSDLRGFSKSYESPSFAREEKNLIKLRAFFDAKLPK
jgi:uncharacterized membrane protein YkvA (DUF1232 family)